MTAAQNGELVEWMAWAFNALATGSIWDDLTPRSQDNAFDWRNAPVPTEVPRNTYRALPTKPY